MIGSFKSFLQRLILILIITTIVVGCGPSAQHAADTESPVPTNGLPASIGSPAPEPTSTITPKALATGTLSNPISLVNPGFEDKNPDGSLAGWNSTGFTDAAIVEDRGHTGDYRLTHKGTNLYQVETSQQATGLSDGWYTLGAWVRSTGGQAAAYMSLDCGSIKARVNIPSTMPGYRWVHLTVSTEVTGGVCTIRLFSLGSSDTWASFDDLDLAPGFVELSILGADISSLKKSEDMGGIYKYSDGTPGDALQILKDHGLNYARLRVWVNPADGYHNKAELLQMAPRFKALGMKLLVDFHYSDDWADPGKQYKPAVWENYNFDQLKQAVYDHTHDVICSLADQGTPPEMVQLGNEINAGMLWPDGDYNHFNNLAALLKAGYQAVEDCSSSTLIMLHIAEGGDNEMARWWFDNITRRDVPFDIIGISYYPFWHGSLAALQANLNDISSRYDKDVIVVETAYAFTDQQNDSLANIASRRLAVTGYPFTPEGQRLMLRDIMTIIRGVNNGRGLGVFWWDATWTAVLGNGWDTTDPKSGNAWENQALFNYQNLALPAMSEFLNP